MATLLLTTGERNDIEPIGRFFNAKQLKEIIGGNFNTINLTSQMSLVVDFNGLERGLPKNEYASSLLCASIYPRKDIIVGNALLCRTNQILLSYDPDTDREKGQTTERVDRVLEKA